MHDNLQEASTVSVGRTFDADHALPGHHVIVIEGRDAVAFAQAQTMNDVAALADGEWHWNGWLTPKGRVVALFALLRFSTESVWLLVTDADADALVTSLKRFVFRSKVVMHVDQHLRACGAFEPPAQARGAVLAQRDGAVEMDMGGAGGARAIRIVTGDAEPDALTLADAVIDAVPVNPPQESSDFERAWALFDIAHGWPRLAPDQFDAWTPQQLSLDRLRAFSVKKGCYPGQEIVARTHFLGKAKRGLKRLRCVHASRVGQVVDGSDRVIGQLVSAVGVEGLAVMPIETTGPLISEGAACEMLEMRDGLAR